MQGNETAMPTHELHQANAVRVARGLHVGGINRLLRLTAGSVEAERPVEDGDVIVNGLRYTNHGNLVANLLGTREGLERARLRAIATNHEVLLDILLLQSLGNFHVCRVATITDKDGASFLVDVLHNIRRQGHPSVGLHHAFVASPAAVNVLYTVPGQSHHQLANHGVQARAQASTCDDHGRACTWSKVQNLPRAAAQELEVGTAPVITTVVAHERLR
mmetsp:Transcript_56997/g.133686  ORF Transcript_56997/g.133686 Transcript_56997/m.133686 type:complete len:218 (-) Transcript_56997:1459-2112(-)